MFIYVTYIYDEMDVLGLCADLTERISFCLLTVYPFLKLLHKIYIQEGFDIFQL